MTVNARHFWLLEPDVSLAADDMLPLASDEPECFPVLAHLSLTGDRTEFFDRLVRLIFQLFRRLASFGASHQ